MALTGSGTSAFEKYRTSEDTAVTAGATMNFLTLPAQERTSAGVNVIETHEHSGDFREW